jgi:hypothetical protein
MLQKKSVMVFMLILSLIALGSAMAQEGDEELDVELEDGQKLKAEEENKADPESELSAEELQELQGMTAEDVGAGPEVFDEGVKYYYDGKYVFAVQRLWDYLSANQPGAKHYGYAEYFLALSLEKLEFTHAAIEYFYNVAKNRTKPELLPDALDAIERITRKYPYDQELIIKDLIYDTNFGFIRIDLRDFIEYQQGLMDFRNGFIKWGHKHFSKIEKNSYYYYKAQYVIAVYHLVRHNLDQALKIFQSILEADIDQADVVNDSRQSVARILFEQKKYQAAYDMYEEIDAPIEKQASVFLEEAWTMYYMKNHQRAMGLLYALEAPAFFRYFCPEKFLIKALIYQNLCHYNVAKDAIAEYHQYYGEAIEAIYDRVDLEDNSIILDAALQEPALVEMAKFQRLLNTELGLLGDFDFAWEDNGLIAHLSRVYELKLGEINRRIKKRLGQAVRGVAEELLEFEEQMNLLEYEIGLAIYKRIKGTPKEKEAEAELVPYSSAQVFYEFDGEFWNDELHDFRFFIEDRCFSEERWE